METATRTISPSELVRRQEEGEVPLLIDVRSAAEYDWNRSAGTPAQARS